MGISIRHVFWCSATLSLGAFVYVMALEPIDPVRNPRAGALNRIPSRQMLIGQVRRALAEGQMSRADRLSDELLGQNPEDLAAMFYRAIVSRALGHDDEAGEFWAVLSDQMESLDSWTNRYSMAELSYFRGWAMIGTGRIEAGRSAFMDLSDTLEARSKNKDGQILDPGVHYNLACYRAMGGQPERAMEHWRASVENGYGQGLSGDGGWWMVDPDLEVLHSDDRFWVIGSVLLSGGERERRQGG